MELDKDLLARQEARVLAAQAGKAQEILAGFPQEKLDAIVEAVAKAFAQSAFLLAELAVRETGFGNVEDKTTKNLFASEAVLSAVKDMKTVGILSENSQKRLWEVGVPVGVIAGIVPSTNPTSTVCYKSIMPSSFRPTPRPSTAPGRRWRSWPGQRKGRERPGAVWPVCRSPAWRAVRN